MIDCGARVALIVRVRGGRVRQVDLAELHVGERHHVDLAGAVDAQQRGLRVGALATHHRGKRVARLRMHGEVGHRNLADVGAEQRGDLLVERRDRLGAGRAAGGRLAEVEREDRRRLRVAGEQHAVGAECKGTNRLERGIGAVGRIGPLRGGHAGPGHHDREDQRRFQEQRPHQGTPFAPERRAKDG